MFITTVEANNILGSVVIIIYIDDIFCFYYMCKSMFLGDYEICGFQLKMIVAYSSGHFLLSACVGWLVYFLMLTTFSHISQEYQKKLTRGFGIHKYSLCVALLCSVCVHILEDYTLGLF
jgi:hypothetical protein